MNNVQFINCFPVRGGKTKSQSLNNARLAYEFSVHKGLRNKKIVNLESSKFRKHVHDSRVRLGLA
jgi:hypothetical protein